jgi:hypothetical protein
MQYILLIYDNGKNQLPPDEVGKIIQDYGAFTQGVIKSGNFKAADRLQSASTATTVRVRDGKTLRVDGPFAETKEQLGGFYMIEAENLDQAVAISARVPSARYGAIEVRPIMKM